MDICDLILQENHDTVKVLARGYHESAIKVYGSCELDAMSREIFRRDIKFWKPFYGKRLDSYLTSSFERLCPSPWKGNMKPLIEG